MSVDTEKGFKRTQYLVAKKIQFRFAVFVMFFVVSVSVATSAAVFFSTLFVLGDKLAAVYPQGRLMPIIQSAYLTFFVIIGISIPIVLFTSIRFSHRIVGPLPKIYRYLAELGNGTYPGRLIIRSKDELHDLAGAINRMADNLKAKGVVVDDGRPNPPQDKS